MAKRDALEKKIENGLKMRTTAKPSQNKTSNSVSGAVIGKVAVFVLKSTYG